MSDKTKGKVVYSSPTVFKKDKDGNKIEVFDNSKEGKRLSRLYRNVRDWHRDTKKISIKQKKLGGFRNIEPTWIEPGTASLDD